MFCETHAVRHYDLDELTNLDEENDMVELPLIYTKKTNRDPVVLISGLAGSQLESYQTNETKWERMWVKVRQVVSDFDQFKKNFVPINDPVTNTYSNRDGLIGIAYMDDTLSWFTGTYQPLIEALQEVRYKVQKDLWGVPKTGTQIRMLYMNDTWTTTDRNWMSIAAYHSLKVMNKPQEHPGVPTHVFFSHGKKTTTSIVIKEEKEKWWKEEAEGVIGDGDGTVPLASLLVPLKWKNENNHPLEFHEFDDISHGQILKDKKFVAKIISIVAQDRQEPLLISALLIRHPGTTITLSFSFTCHAQ
ncbi:hypothetical protein BLNAU_23899 [Blattamonas nauphoetae]|uniref:Uncharacterized protein n=1 Tax=Blattamonas nauphoetae TaxID=2049346 RepID=A0ABQ9WT24_9EUKA|nr:hypothetical protein BLNAU_23899 [Blattamonas nauphoetae]